MARKKSNLLKPWKKSKAAVDDDEILNAAEKGTELHVGTKPHQHFNTESKRFKPHLVDKMARPKIIARPLKHKNTNVPVMVPYSGGNMTRRRAIRQQMKKDLHEYYKPKNKQGGLIITGLLGRSILQQKKKEYIASKQTKQGGFIGSLLAYRDYVNPTEFVNYAKHISNRIKGRH